MQPIYFIASYPRSGNTWVRAFFYRLLQRRGLIADTGGLNALDTAIPWDATPRLYAALSGSREPLPAARAAPLRPRVHQMIAERASSPPFVKTHAAFGLFAGHPTFNVRATRGAVYIVRNPRNVAQSLAKMLSLDLAGAVRVMTVENAHQPPGPNSVWEPWSSWSTNVLSWTGAADFPVRVVRYEDLVAEPRRLFPEIAQHAGVPVETGDIEAILAELTLERMKEMAESGQLPVPLMNSDRPFVGSQLDGRVPDDDPVFAPLSRSFGDLMRRYGYDP